MIKEMKMTHWKQIALSALTVAAMTGCGDTTITYGDSTVIIGDTTPTTPPNETPEVVLDLLNAASSLPTETLSGSIASSRTLTNDKLWLLSGQVVVESGVTLTIEPGTVIAGIYGDGAAAGWMVVDKDAMIIADGTAEEPIIFTSQRRVSDPTNNLPYQWGGLTIIGNAEMTGQVTSYEVTLPRLFEPGSGNAADNSGILRNVHILNTGIGVGTGDTEINGLSLVAVGNGTIIEDITVDYSGDDGIEIWGGTVNLTNIKISHCTDDHLDVDDGYSGTVKNFEINVLITGDELGYAGIEQSGQTYAHYEDFVINIMDQESEGGIFFKGTTIGGHFKNGTINYMSEAAGAIYSDGDASTFIEDPSYTTIEGVTINAYPGYAFLNKDNDDTYSADNIENTFFFDGNSYGNTVEDL